MKLHQYFGKTAAQIKGACQHFVAGDIGYIDGYVYYNDFYAIFVRTKDGKIGEVPLPRIEALLAEEMLG